MNRTLSPEDYLKAADHLPAAPRILPRLLSLLSDPDTDLAEVIELISFDPGVTARVLRTCNSAYIGLTSRANDLSEAVNMLGVRRVYDIVAVACGSSALQSGSNERGSIELWQHSVTTALAAQLLAKDVQLNEGMLFTAALLHDIGKVVLAQTWKDDYWRLVANSRCQSSELTDCERQHYSITHAELGGRLLARWQFPPLIATTVWNHHSPIPGQPFDKDTACVTIAEAVANITLQDQAGQESSVTPGQMTALELLGFSTDALQLYVGRARENFEFVDAMCQFHS